MRKSFTLIILFILLLDGIAQVDASFSIKRFNSPKTPYIENYLKIYASSINYKKDQLGHVQYNIQVTQVLKQDTNIIDFKKYIIENLDTSKNLIVSDLIDQQRFYVENIKTYELEIFIEDLLSSVKVPKKIIQKINIQFSDVNIEFSDIELIEQYSIAEVPTIITKSGYNIVPMPEDFYGHDYQKIAYYTEIYNTEIVLDTNGKYLLNQFIENYDSKELVGEFNKIKRYTSTQIQPILNVWDIENLPTGNYSLVLQIKNQDNEVVTEKKQRFQRLNLSKSVQVKDLNTKSYENTFVSAIETTALNEHIKCLSPIASDLEKSTIDNQLSNLTENMKREFIYQFWKNKNSSNPDKEWRDYERKLEYAQQQYGTRTLKGYESDRGRIYLLYGIPNSINDQPNSSNSYPYQVWHYYRAGKFNNKTCIFYSPNIIGNEYLLLHSDIPGENKDTNWQRTLKKRSNGVMDEDLKHQSWEQY